LSENLPFVAANRKAFSAVQRSDVAAVALEPLIVEVSFDDQIVVYSCLHHWTQEQVVSSFFAAPALIVEPADDVEVVAVVTAAADVVAVAAESEFAEGLPERQHDPGPEAAVAGVEPEESLEAAGTELGQHVEVV
jgi:hypothetical protein